MGLSLPCSPPVYLQLGTQPLSHRAAAWVPVSRGVREGPWRRQEGPRPPPSQSQDPLPRSLCAPQTSLLSVLLHRAHSPPSLRKCCSLGLKDFSSASRLNGNIPFRPCSLSKSCHTRLQPPCALLLSHPCPSAWHNHSRCPVQMSTRGQGHHYYPCPSRAGQSIHQPNL